MNTNQLYNVYRGKHLSRDRNDLIVREFNYLMTAPIKSIKLIFQLQQVAADRIEREATEEEPCHLYFSNRQVIWGVDEITVIAASTGVALNTLIKRLGGGLDAPSN